MKISQEESILIKKFLSPKGVLCTKAVAWDFTSRVWNGKVSTVCWRKSCYRSFL